MQNYYIIYQLSLRWNKTYSIATAPTYTSISVHFYLHVHLSHWHILLAS